MIKAALFDLDGVVFNTEPQYTVFWGSEGKRYFPEDPDFCNKIKGMTLGNIFSKFFGGLVEEQPKIEARLDEYESKMDYEYLSGFQEFVSALREKGFKTAVVTSSNRKKMSNIYLKHPEFKSMFDLIFTAELFTRSKPAPDCYLQAASYFGLKPQECIGFEDSFNGLRSLRAAGTVVVGVASTNSRASISPLADVVIDDYSDWPVHLGKYLNC